MSNHRGRLTHWISIQRDVSERKAIEAAALAARIAEAERRSLEHAAYHDDLTGLHNRAYFIERLEQGLARERLDPAACVALIFFDLDRFKAVNDKLGHRIGDLLLVEIAKRLQTCVRGTDVLARLGGDEFAVLVHGVAIDEVCVVAKRIGDAIGRSVVLEGNELAPSASIGIAESRAGYAHSADLLRDADTAMYRAKARFGARGGYVVFDASMRREVAAARQLEADLREAVIDRDFSLVFQPLVELARGRFVGFEALVRWRHHERGVLEPQSFLGLADEIDVIGALDRFVVGAACRELATWRRTTGAATGLLMSANVSRRELLRAEFSTDLLEIVRDAGIEPNALQLDISENLFNEDPLVVGRTLGRLRDLGIRVALDDFGIGYSSLGYLRQFRVDALKIHGSFVGHLGSRSNRDIVRSIVALGEALDIEVWAEGIETANQVDILRTLGCRFGQGHYFMPAIAPPDVPALLQRVGDPHD